MPQKRAVFGKIYRTDGVAPWVGAPVMFQRTPASYTPNEQFPEDVLTTTVDIDGNFSIDLWCNTEGLKASEYICFLPDGERIKFSLPVGVTPIPLSTLRESTTPISPTQFQSMLGYVDQQDSTLQSQINVLAIPKNYDRTFTDADLSIAGVLSVVHGLNTYPSSIKIWDPTGMEAGSPDSIAITSLDTVAIVLKSFRPLLPGFWKVSITA